MASFLGDGGTLNYTGLLQNSMNGLSATGLHILKWLTAYLKFCERYLFLGKERGRITMDEDLEKYDFVSVDCVHVIVCAQE